MKKKNVSGELGLSITPPTLPAPPLDYQLGINSTPDDASWNNASGRVIGKPSTAQVNSAKDLANQLYPAATDYDTLNTQLEEITARINGLKSQIGVKSGVGKVLSLGRQYKKGGRSDEEINDIIAKINAFVTKRAQIEASMVKAKKSYEAAQAETKKQEDAAAAAAAAQNQQQEQENNANKSKTLLYVAIGAIVLIGGYMVVKKQG